MKSYPGKRRLAYERACLKKGYRLVIGIDEAGRGPLAGPVVAAAAALLDAGARDAALRRLLGEVDDSKKLSAAKRETLFSLMARHRNLVFAFAAVPPKTIDRINILEATKMAMAKAVAGLVAGLAQNRGGSFVPGRIFCVLDGNFSASLPYDQESVVAADAKIFSVAAASIIAKVSRDRMMARLDKKFPGYGFARHKGYPTRQHRAALERRGPSPAHRMSFAPCAAFAPISHRGYN